MNDTAFQMFSVQEAEDQSVVIDLNEQEANLLISLEPYAHAAAPLLRSAICVRMANGLYSSDPLAYEVVRDRLHGWFLHLFQEERGPCKGRRYGPSGYSRYSCNIPLSYILQVMDLLLKYGEDITMHSSHPEQAWMAFLKRFAQNLSQYEAQEKQHQNMLTEMMLLD
ncbi:MAG: hypothetical protein EHM70_14165 [Chloroflexota bacterium]|nr:MAG: hypothetical protein EHM70_14165 [Chloroflexota bacterium]